MDAINLILFAVLFVLQVAIILLLLRRRSGDAGHQTELLARQRVLYYKMTRYTLL